MGICRGIIVIVAIFAVFDVSSIAAATRTQNACVQTLVPVTFPDSSALATMRVLMAPITTSMAAMKRMASGQTGCQIVSETVEQEGPYMLAYLLLALGSDLILKVFYDVDYKTFEEKSSRRMRPSPKRVLFVSGFSLGNDLSQYPELYFNHLYGKVDAQFLHVNDFDDLIKKLRKLPQKHQFDRIEIMAHGNPGVLYFGEGPNSRVDIKDIQKLRNANLKISSADGELRLISCSLAANPAFSDKGERMIQAFGRSLLPEGGRVFAATKNIIFRYPSKRLNVLAFGAGVYNIGNLIRIAPEVWRDYTQVYHDFIEVEIAAGGNASGCSKLKSSSARRLN